MYTLLLVDDHKHLVESMMTTIDWKKLGIEDVYGAYSGDEALACIRTQSIDVLVTDIRMPGLSGLELIEQARQLHEGIVCILLTGYSEFQYAKRAIELQAIQYLLKPVRDEELLAAAADAISRVQERRSSEELAGSIERTLTEERRRIAHDLHDVVGYTLTGTLIQMEAAKKLLASNKAEGFAKLEQSRQLIRQGLTDMRETVHGLFRGEDTSIASELSRIAEEAELYMHVRVTLTIAPETDRIVDSAILHALTLSCKEGITNGMRHGGAARFKLSASMSDSAVIVELWNDGIPYDGHSYGFGLRMMADRIERIGGTIRLDAAVDGSVLAIRIPLEGGSSLEPKKG